MPLWDLCAPLLGCSRAWTTSWSLGPYSNEGLQDWGNGALNPMYVRRNTGHVKKDQSTTSVMKSPVMKPRGYRNNGLRRQRHYTEVRSLSTIWSYRNTACVREKRCGLYTKIRWSLQKPKLMEYDDCTRCYWQFGVPSLVEIARSKPWAQQQLDSYRTGQDKTHSDPC